MLRHCSDRSYWDDVFWNSCLILVEGTFLWKLVFLQSGIIYYLKLHLTWPGCNVWKRFRLLIEGDHTEPNPNKAEFPANCSIQVSLVQMAARASQRLHPHLPTPAGCWPWMHTNDPQLLWLQAPFPFLLGHPTTSPAEGKAGALRKSHSLGETWFCLVSHFLIIAVTNHLRHT